MVAELVAATNEDLIEILRQTDRVVLYSSGTHTRFRRLPDPAATRLTLALSGIVRHDISDQVVVLRANTSLAELQSELVKNGQCIPYLPFNGSSGVELNRVKGSVAGHLSMNLPHSYEAWGGSWKDWLLGAKVVLADGLSAKCGSQVVKNVAGYDLHKFLIGARGTIAVITEITLRTWPLKALVAPDLAIGMQPMTEAGVIQRTLPSEFFRWKDLAAADLIATHPRTSTLYRACSQNEIPSKPEDGWSLGWGLGDRNVTLPDATFQRYFDRAKKQFDPGLKLNSTDLEGQP